MKTTNSRQTILMDAIRSYIILAIIYVVCIFVLPANLATMHRYHLSATDYRFLYLLVTLPSLGVWFAAFYGYARLSQYTDRIKKSKEGPSFETLTKGLTWLAWSLPIPSIASIILSAIGNQHPGFHSAAIIVINYLLLLLPLIAFTIIGRAARLLLTSVRKETSLAGAQGIVGVFVVAGVTYCYLIFRHFTSSSLGSTNNPYDLPIWLMLLTVIIPYMYAWFVGLLASYEIITYSNATKGLLYKKPLQILVGGLVAVVISSIATQYIGSIVPVVGHLVFNYKLLLTTIFRVIGGIGYILIAVGASRLKRIEDI